MKKLNSNPDALLYSAIIGTQTALELYKQELIREIGLFGINSKGEFYTIAHTSRLAEREHDFINASRMLSYALERKEE